MANEGDSRSWSGFTEDVRVSALPHPLNPAIFTSAACGGTCNANARLGRLTVTSALGLNPITNQYDALYAFGGRSFSTWDGNGNQVWDSGAQFEQRTTALSLVNFNADEEGNDIDNRSDNKGRSRKVSPSGAWAPRPLRSSGSSESACSRSSCNSPGSKRPAGALAPAGRCSSRSRGAGDLG